jgi:superfamily II DNA/RNA helicase
LSVSFSDLGVSPELVARLRARGIESPFPIQEATLPDALAGRDICGRAPTGSGKTLAFGLALASRPSAASPKRPTALVLVPTRELAAQVERELAALSPDGHRRTIAVYGGTGYTAARNALARGVDTVVACPGRLEDLIAQRTIDLGNVRVVVLDEADRMVDMGFLPAVRRILDRMPAGRQMMLFSATLGREVEGLVREYQSDPVRHDIVADESTLNDVSHLFWNTDREDQLNVTVDLVRKHGRALIFCRTRRGADRLARQLNLAGVRAAAIHGDRSQSQREKALATFADGATKALVATDVAARGIHVEDLPCVVHYDLPADSTDYLHRSGRTGRAGKTGVVVSLVRGEQREAGRALQRSLGLDTRTGERHAAPGERHAAPGERHQGPRERGSAPTERHLAPRDRNSGQRERSSGRGERSSGRGERSSGSAEQHSWSPERPAGFMTGANRRSAAAGSQRSQGDPRRVRSSGGRPTSGSNQSRSSRVKPGRAS